MSTTQRSAATRSTYKDQKGKDLNAAYDDYMDDIDAIWNNCRQQMTWHGPQQLCSRWWATPAGRQ